MLGQKALLAWDPVLERKALLASKHVLDLERCRQLVQAIGYRHPLHLRHLGMRNGREMSELQTAAGQKMSSIGAAITRCARYACGGCYFTCGWK